MRFKDVFSIIGPSMIGPSSSHTAGAVRIGRTARKLLGDIPEQVEISLYGSFATTYLGHGTDLALVAGLLDFHPDDERLSHSMQIAKSHNMNIHFRPLERSAPHPNTAFIRVSAGQRTSAITGCSIGGGNIEIIAVDHFDVRFKTVYPTLLIFHKDRPGMIEDITKLLRKAGINISCMEVDRQSRMGEVLTVIESDEAPPKLCIEAIDALPDVQRVCLVDLDSAIEGEERG